MVKPVLHRSVQGLSMPCFSTSGDAYYASRAPVCLHKISSRFMRDASSRQASSGSRRGEMAALLLGMLRERCLSGNKADFAD